MKARQLALVAVMERRRRDGRRVGVRRKRPGLARGKHRVRPFHDPRLPVHVVLRVSGEVGRLRRRVAYQAMRWAMIRTLGRHDFRIVHLSIQGNHVHLICEADDRLALANGVRGLSISAAKRLNLAVSKERGVKRRGRVFTDRYHATTIAHPTQARNALAYVLNNWRRHREDRAAWARAAKCDPYSTAVAFPGWREMDGVPFARPAGYEALPAARPQTWLMREGWKLGGAPVSLWEVPGPLAG